MGKLAENEELKLRATFYNNVAVGCAVAGVVVPFLQIYQTISAEDFYTLVPPQKYWQSLLILALAFLLAASFRIVATRIILKMQD